MSGTLFLVGTPIGNLEDFSPRAVRVLREVDFIAAEDTRVTRKLLTHFDIHTALVSYHEHNRAAQGEAILARLLAGENAALVTDAGMPAISDPGEDLVRLCRERGVPVASVPGPTAMATALAMAGLPCGRFCFEGFLSVNKPSRRAHLDALKREERTMVFYEAPHKLSATLCDLLAAFGDREIALVKELTKIHETVERTTLAAAAARYAEEAPRGEYVLIVAGASPEAAPALSLEEAVALARSYVADGMPAAKAARRAAAETGAARGEIYKCLAQN